MAKAFVLLEKENHQLFDGVGLFLALFIKFLLFLSNIGKPTKSLSAKPLQPSQGK
jgi:hypothetical protein